MGDFSNNLRNLLLQAKGMKRQIESDISSKKALLKESNERLQVLEKAQVFLQLIAQDTQNKLKFRIEDIVNMALETCFPDEYDFKLDFNVARGKTECQLVFLSRKTGREIDPMTASGGGVVDVACFALRTACYVLEKGIDNVIVLDEPMKFVSEDLQERVCEVIRNLSEKLGIQFIIVTHIKEFVNIADKLFKVRKGDDGRSVVQCV